MLHELACPGMRKELMEDLQMQEDPGGGKVLWDEQEASTVSAVMDALEEALGPLIDLLQRVRSTTRKANS